jgi:mono/diheme cytochrome c family protein
MTFPPNLIDPTNGQWWYAVILLVLVAPVLEEFVMRAGLHQALIYGLGKSAKGNSSQNPRGSFVTLLVSRPWPRLGLVAAIFGLLHLSRSPWLALAVIPTGVLLGWIFERSRSWKRCALVHAGLNAAWIAIALVATPAHAADAWRGKGLYSSVPSGFLACANSGCHGPNAAVNTNKIRNGANNPAVITSAINGNVGGMGAFKTAAMPTTGAALTATDIADIAAYIGNPTVTAPVGAPIAGISTTSITFASSNLGVASAGQTVTLSNTGTAALAVSAVSLSGTNAAEFSSSGSGACVAGGSLAAGANCTISLGFTPAAVGARSASLTITHALGSSTVLLSGSGLGAASASVSPGSIAFSSTIVGTSATTQQVTLNNSGTAALSVSSISSSVPSEFPVSGSGACSATGGSLAAGTSCTITVGFSPAVVGSRTASLAVNHSLGQSTVGLSGAGAAVPQATLTINQSLLNFGTVTQGTTSALQTVTISNSGTAPLTLSSISISGSTGVYLTAGTCATGVAIASTGTCTVTVSFAPNAIASFPSSLVLASNASNGSISVTLQGAGAAVPAAIMAVSPSTLAFGNQTVNVNSGIQFITVQNNGNASAAISSVTLTGSTMFTLLNPTACGSSLAANGSCILQLQFKPTSASAQTASLQVVSNAAGSPYQVSVTGTGVLQPTPSPSLSQSAVVTFADTTLGQTDPAMTSATAGNTGTASYTLTAVSLSGLNPSDFLLGGTCIAGKVVASATTCTLTVQFKPSAIGFRTARVNLVTDSFTTLGFDVEGNGKAVATISAQLTSSINFGTVFVGNTSSIGKATLTNSGNQPLNVSAVTVAAPYQLTSGGTCPSTLPFILPSGAPCDFAMTFSPTVAGANSVAGTLGVTTNAPNSPHATTLSGIGSSVPVVASPTVVTPPTVTPPPAVTPPSTTPNSATPTPVTPTGAAVVDPNATPIAASAPKEAGTPAALSNIGAGGCTMSSTGNDASMVLLLLAALLTGLWRRSFSRTTSKNKDSV